MYYSLEPPSNFHNFAEIQNNNIDQIDGLLLSTVIGQYGVCRIQQCQNSLQEIEQWLLSLGYYYDSVVPQAILGQHDNYLSHFPDNEEILVFYNNSSRPIKIHIENSTQILPTLKFAVKNWFDDLWCETINHEFNTSKHFFKDIRKAVNFESSNRSKYNAPRFNHRHLLKMLPRHPLKTACVFYPEPRINSIKEWSVFDLDENYQYYKNLFTTTLYRGFEIEIKPHDIVLLDQLITRFYLEPCNELEIKIYPLWYKTEVRKHFNYSL